jgi:hypothetical protein
MRACLFDVRVIMIIMHVHVVELLCQTVMGYIPILKCLLCVWVLVVMCHHARHSMPLSPKTRL